MSGTSTLVAVVRVQITTGEVGAQTGWSACRQEVTEPYWMDIIYIWRSRLLHSNSAPATHRTLEVPVTASACVPEWLFARPRRAVG